MTALLCEEEKKKKVGLRLWCALLFSERRDRLRRAVMYVASTRASREGNTLGFIHVHGGGRSQRSLRYIAALPGLFALLLAGRDAVHLEAFAT